MRIFVSVVEHARLFVQVFLRSKKENLMLFLRIVEIVIAKKRQKVVQ
jgi:hypothetical protein